MTPHEADNLLREIEFHISQLFEKLGNAELVFKQREFHDPMNASDARTYTRELIDRLARWDRFKAFHEKRKRESDAQDDFILFDNRRSPTKPALSVVK